VTGLEQLLGELVAIDSINPDLVPGAAGEAGLAGHVAAWLERAGLDVRIEEAAPGRPSVVAIARGTGGGRTLMLNGHLDTVGVAGMAEPFRPRVEDGRLYGRGAYDMKGGLAACMTAAAEALERRLRGDVILTAVADEEYAGRGTMGIATRYHADGAVIAESTDLELVLAHKGFVWLEIETAGVAAHGSRPELGLDAIVKMGRVLVELERLGAELRAHPTHRRLGSGSVHASLIEGGQELSSYPGRCLLSLERRTVPGETPEAVEAELREIVERVGRSDPSFKAVVRRGLDRTPLETPEDADIVGTMERSATKVLSLPPAVTGVPYWTDAATLWAAGVPTVLFGPSGAGAHAVSEWVDLDSVRNCAEIYLACALEFCG